jgi:hypothetical protein
MTQVGNSEQSKRLWLKLFFANATIIGTWLKRKATSQRPDPSNAYNLQKIGKVTGNSRPPTVGAFVLQAAAQKGSAAT